MCLKTENKLFKKKRKKREINHIHNALKNLTRNVVCHVLTCTVIQLLHGFFPK